MTDTLAAIIDQYRPELPLEEARTIPASWYVDPRILELEQRTTFAETWQYAGRLDQVREPGEFVTGEFAGEPIVVVRGSDGVLRGFFNVCRHHAAAVVTEPAGCLKRLRCPYHGWTYALEGALKAAPDFEGVQDFDPADNGLVPVATTVWENVGVRAARGRRPVARGVPGRGGRLAGATPEPLGPALVRPQALRLDCNWKVFVDNYLDGGYHVPLPAPGPGQRARLQQVHDRERRAATACSRARW